MISTTNVFRDLRVGDVARDHRLTYFDVGARGGLQPDLDPLAFAVDVVGFEPDLEAYRALDGVDPGPWASVRYLPLAVSAEGGRQTLFIATDPESASLHRPRAAPGVRFNKRQFFTIERTIDVETVTLGEALARSGCARIDYLKIDIEGAELGVLRSAADLVDDMLAIKTEVAFTALRENHPTASEVDSFLVERGFVLMDLTGPARWRREGHVVHPHVGTASPPYAKGQLIHGDLLYVKDPETGGRGAGRPLELGLVYLALGYFDHALMVWERPEVRALLAERYAATPLGLVHPASTVYGRRVALRAFLAHLRAVVPHARGVLNAWRARAGGRASPTTEKRGRQGGRGAMGAHDDAS